MSYQQFFTLYFGDSEGEQRVMHQAEGLREYLPYSTHADRVLITRFLMGLNPRIKHESIVPEAFMLAAIRQFEEGVSPSCMAVIENAWRNGFQTEQTS